VAFYKKKTPTCYLIVGHSRQQLKNYVPGRLPELEKPQIGQVAWAHPHNSKKTCVIFMTGFHVSNSASVMFFAILNCKTILKLKEY
jgi:hypothetical protein